MTQNYLILAFFIELAIFYLIIYSIIKANNWVINQQQVIEDLLVTVPENFRQYRSELRNFNKKVNNPEKVEPLSVQEIGFLAGSIFSEIFKSKFPVLPFGKNFIIISVLTKLWKYRHRLKATFVK